jgi:cytochrome o ubiquinol oxidase subunit 2
MKKSKFLLILLIPVLLVILFILLSKGGNLQLLNPQGYIAQQQSKILIGALILAACIGIPVVGIVFFVVFHFSEDNKKSKYNPNWSSSKFLTAVWWVVPTLIILFLGIINWKTAHQLDPYKPITASAKPITIQVVALQWKWLFIYPEQRIATVNFIEIPVNTPVNFQLTADAPMNSFWIPSLAGQIYAMAGMTTQLHILASKQGDFPGGAAEINGEGFSGMNFTVRSTTHENFDKWVTTVQKTGEPLTLSSYNKLSQPSTYNPRAYYYYADRNLYNEVIQKFMAPSERMMMPGMK